MIEAVILDVDGTIVDSVDLHAEAWKVTAKPDELKAYRKIAKPI